MICIARTFGAPETVPAGKHDTSASSRSRSSASFPSTIEVRCITCEKRSRPMNCGTRTDPYAQTRPTSLRPRSTSMTCSARSFSLRFSSSASRMSSSSFRPRRREHDLIDVAGGDVFLGRADRLVEALPRVVRPELGAVGRLARRPRQVALELALEELNLRAREVVQQLQILVRRDARIGAGQDA